jgi:hypothetical protein
MTTTPYNADQAQKICARIADGEPLVAICRDPATPDWETICAWRVTRPSFRARLVRARQFQAEILFEEIAEIATELRSGDVASAGDVARAKLRIDTLKWLVGRMAPAMDAERKSLDHEGGEAPEPFERITGVPRD